MLEIIGYMIVAYGVARLLQTSEILDKSMKQIVGALGIGALVLLGVMLSQQADTLAGIGGGL